MDSNGNRAGLGVSFEAFAGDIRFICSGRSITVKTLQQKREKKKGPVDIPKIL